MESLKLDQSNHRAGTVAPLGLLDRDIRPRLPTPETSLSSEDTHHDGYSPNKRRRVEDGLRYTHRSDVTTPVDIARPTFRSRRDSAFHSPLQRSADLQKPSLPSLSTILNGDHFSPPKTPSPLHTLREPSSREPKFMSSSADVSTLSTFPARAHPMEFTSTSKGTEATCSQSSRSSIMEPRTDGSAFRPSIALPPITAHFEPRDARRPTFPPFTARHAPPSPYWTTRYPSPASHPKPSDDRYIVDAHNAHRTPDRTPVSSTTSRAGSFVGTYAEPYKTYSDECRDNTTHRDYAEPSVPRSMRPVCQVSCQPYMHSHSRELPDRQYYSDPSREAREHYQRGLCDEQHRSMGVPVSYPALHSPSSFFMPNHFDYQHGKSRKRSNLPKQSTEIMKQWFDQNLSNPYPSEEQKQHFSNVTGISMTQVSNWFINHRRRCPELRDKRDKCRGRDDEI